VPESVTHCISFHPHPGIRSMDMIKVMIMFLFVYDHVFFSVSRQDLIYGVEEVAHIF
jgi:hypothetical protein